MANRCDYCDKKRDMGHNVSHAKNRSKRARKPNLHTYRMPKGDGTRIKLRLCTSCLRSVKSGKISKQKMLQTVGEVE